MRSKFTLWVNSFRKIFRWKLIVISLTFLLKLIFIFWIQIFNFFIILVLHLARLLRLRLIFQLFFILIIFFLIWNSFIINIHFFLILKVWIKSIILCILIIICIINSLKLFILFIWNILTFLLFLITYLLLRFLIFEWNRLQIFFTYVHKLVKRLIFKLLLYFLNVIILIILKLIITCLSVYQLIIILLSLYKSIKFRLSKWHNWSWKHLFIRLIPVKSCKFLFSCCILILTWCSHSPAFFFYLVLLTVPLPYLFLLGIQTVMIHSLLKNWHFKI